MVASSFQPQDSLLLVACDTCDSSSIRLGKSEFTCLITDLPRTYMENPLSADRVNEKPMRRAERHLHSKQLLCAIGLKWRCLSNGLSCSSMDLINEKSDEHEHQKVKCRGQEDDLLGKGTCYESPETRVQPLELRHDEMRSSALGVMSYRQHRKRSR
ncbi:hypothetical protein STEG23_023486 [Scotinomys teguina]